MEKEYKKNKTVTIIYIVLAVLLIIDLFGGLFYFGMSLKGFDWIGNAINEASGHELTGGYEIIGALGLGLLDGLIMFAAFFMAAIGAMYGIPAVIVSVGSVLILKKYKETLNPEYLTKDKKYKLIVSCVTMAVYILMAVPAAAIRAGLAMCLPVFVMALPSAIGLYNEQKPKNYEAEYTEFNDVR